MKTKIMAFAAAAAIASCANAGVLYWQVNDAASIVDAEGGTPSSDAQSAYSSWDRAALVKYNNAVTDHANASGGTAVLSVPANTISGFENGVATTSATGSGFVTSTQMAEWEAAAADMNSYSSGYFYVELFNSTTGNRVGRSQDYLAFEDGKLVSSDVNSTTDFLSTSQFKSDALVWNGGATFVAVPEPTSGLMLLLGAAVLGLRRKRRV